jgi:hypothetical protein
MTNWEFSVIDPRITDHLKDSGVSHAVIGAVSLAVHGAPRYSDDLDILVTDTSVLDPSFWVGADITPTQIRRGNWDDPLAGLVDFPTPPGEIPVQLVVGKGYAPRVALETAEANAMLQCPVVSPLGLALLKLEAGGIRDLQDLVALDEAQRILTGWPMLQALEPHITKLSRNAQSAWNRLLGMISPKVEPPKPIAPPPVAPKTPPKGNPGSSGQSR